MAAQAELVVVEEVKTHSSHQGVAPEMTGDGDIGAVVGEAGVD